MEPKRFRDFAKEELPLTGDKVKLETILGKEVLVSGYRIKESKYSKRNSHRCLMIQLNFDGEDHVIFTGSTVLADQIERYKDEIPFLTSIVQIDKYFTFT